MAGASICFLLICALFAAAHSLPNGAGLLPPLGWSTWCSGGPCSLDRCNQNEVMEAAAAMAQNGMLGLGYKWILLDDCWAAGKRGSSGELTWDTGRFPDGIPQLVRWLHARGFLFGLYTSAGNETCKSGGRPYPIPGSEGHFVQDANTFARWDVDYVKVDWCGDVHSMPLDGIAVGAKYYRDFSHAITNATPHKTMYFEGVAAYLFLLGDVATYVNAWRASTDHHDNWKNTMGVMATVNLVGKKGAPGAWSYNDVLVTGGEGCSAGQGPQSFPHCPGMTDAEYRSEFAMWSIVQSPLIVATDIRNFTAIMAEILLRPRILAAHQMTATPPGGLFAGDASCGTMGELLCQVYVRAMPNNTFLVALVNAADNPRTITFEFASALHTWPAGSVALVEDLWGRAENTTASRSISFLLGVHDTAYVWIHPQHAS